MALVWNELKPVDGFRMVIADSLSPLHIKTMTDLYQPIMGSTSYALYLTMAHEAEGERFFSFERNHQWLMNILNVPLDQLYKARLRLEALGLLKTYEIQNDEEYACYEYRLLVPLSPSEFFEDDILSICLYNKVGANRYKDIRATYSAYFVDPNESVSRGKKELTKEFHEVFSSLSPSELIIYKDSETHQELEQWKEEYPLTDSKEETTGTLQFDKVSIDIEALRAFMMNGLYFERVVNDQTLPIIKKLAYFYQLDEWALSRILQDSLTVDEELDLQLFRQKAKEWYRLQEGGNPPKIIQQSQPAQKKKVQKQEKMTEEQKHLLRLENMSPLQLLKAYQGGGKVADADVRLVEELLVDYQLYPGVVNVLIEYIYFTNDFKLPRNLVTKVAAHWKRAKIEDIIQAQEMAKKEHQQYKQWKEQQKETSVSIKRETGTRRSSSYSSKVRKDKLPDWIQKQDNEKEQNQKSEGKRNKNDTTPDQTQKDTLNDQQKRERMEYLLKALGEWDD